MDASIAWCIAMAAAVTAFCVRPVLAVALVAALFAYHRIRTAAQTRRTREETR